MIYFRQIRIYALTVAILANLLACAGDPLESGVDPFAPTVFKEGSTAMPLNPPNKATLVPFYVTMTTSFKFAVDTDSILIGPDGVTRYIVLLTSPNGSQQVQYEGIRCDSYQWRLYGTFDNDKWQENPLGTWKEIKRTVPNRYQAALASGAFCNLNTQEKSIRSILRSLDPKNFSGGPQPTNSFGIGSY